MLSVTLVARGLCLSAFGARTGAFVFGNTAERFSTTFRSIVGTGKSAVTAQMTHVSSCSGCNQMQLAWRSTGSGVGYGRLASSKGGLGSSATEEAVGQDAGEVFDVYLPPESLAVIDGKPKSAGFSKPRGLVHKDGDWHRSVHIWLHNGKGELILQKRSSLKDTFPGMWDVSVGGHFTAGESSLETAIKETQEELGLDCDESTLWFVCTVATSSKGSTPKHGDFLCNEYKDVYLLRYDGSVDDLQFSPGEVEDVKLVHMDRLKEIYAAQDKGYIPRPEYYTDPLFAALKEAIGR